MKKAILPLAIAALASQAHAGTVTTDGADIVIKTKGGFEAKTTDGEYSFKIGGRAQIDYNSYDGVTNAGASDPGATGSDIFFRRARLAVKGHAGDWKYGLSYNLGVDDIESGVDQLKVTYTGFGKMFNITAGQQKENFGLEDTGSSKWITAIERSLVANAFDTGNNIGIKAHGSNDMLTYSLGMFKEGSNNDRELDSAVTGRLVVRPIYSKESVLHLGAGFTQREVSDDVAAGDDGFDDFDSRLGVRGGSDGGAQRFAPKFTSGDGEESSAYNLEVAYASGPLHIMAEYYKGEVDAPESVANSDDLEVDGYYVQAGWILTGESRKYKTSSASFDKVKPKGDKGAWEIFARIDHMSADDGTNINLVGGDDADVLTLGVNWYATPNVKMSLNYINAETDEEINGEDDGDAIAARLQYAF
jgi:phosphate-selective porin OprO/OprP